MSRTMSLFYQQCNSQRLLLVCLLLLLAVVNFTTSSGSLSPSPSTSPLASILHGSILGTPTRDALHTRLAELNDQEKRELRKQSKRSQTEHEQSGNGRRGAMNNDEDDTTTTFTPLNSSSFANASTFLTSFMQCRSISGLAVGVVYKGELIYSNGLGIQSAASQEPVDENTIFGIGSCTKAFTSTLGALLQQDGLLNLDTPVIESYLPDYSTSSLLTTQSITLTDMLVHRTGMAKNDLALFLDHNITRKERVYSIKYLDTTTTLREKFMYNNWMVASAGYVMGEVANAAPNGDWESLISERIFTPLGMSRTYANFSQSLPQANRASPMFFNQTSQEWQDEPYAYNEAIDIAAPAGGIASTINDLAQWVGVHLGYNQAFLANSSRSLLHSPQMVISDGGDDDPLPQWLWDRLNGFEYAYNWWIGRYNTQKFIWHQGDVWGFHAMIGMIPEEELGVIILTNSDSADSGPGQMFYRDIINMYLMDIALGVENPTFSSAEEACGFPCNVLPALCGSGEEMSEKQKMKKLKEAKVALKKQNEKQKKQKKRSTKLATQQSEVSSSTTTTSSSTTSSSCAPNLPDYLGTYYHPAYGSMWVTYTDPTETQLMLSYGTFVYFPTNATLTYQVNGGTDRFVWNIGDTQAQTLYNSEVTFVRNFDTGMVADLYLDTMDSSGAYYKLWFGKEGGSGARKQKKRDEKVEKKSLSLKKMKRTQHAASISSSSIGAAVSSPTSSTPSTPAPTISFTSLLVLLCVSIVLTVTLAGIVFHRISQKHMRSLFSVKTTSSTIAASGETYYSAAAE